MRRIIKPVVIAIIQKDGKYLMTKRSQKKSIHHDKWHFPGGSIKWGESIENALKREMKEELGIEIEVIGLLPKIFEEVRDTGWQGILIYYVCKMKKESDVITLNEEASEYGWFGLEEIKKLPAFVHSKTAAKLAELTTK